MAKFIVTIEEMVSKDFEVEAKDWNEAMDIAEAKYKSGEFILESGELVCKQMAITSPSEESTEWVEF